MRIAAWIVGLLALGCTAAQAQDCHLVQYDSIPFTQTAQGLMVPVQFGATKKELAFSLADSQSGLAADTVDALGLRETHMSQEHNVHHGGATITFIAHAPSVKVGSSTVKDMQFLVLPAAGSDGAAGQLGTTLLKNADLELDMAGKTLNLFSATHCPGKAVYWTTTGYATVPITIDPDGYIRAQLVLDGKPVSMGLNTSGNSVIGLKAAHALFALDTDSPGMTLAFTAPGGVKYYHYAFKMLSADGLSINRPAILVRDDTRRSDCIVGQRVSTNITPDTDYDVVQNALIETSCHAGEDGALGLSVLSRLHLYVSKSEKLLYVTGAAAH
jgi:hypothetical protein